MSKNLFNRRKAAKQFRDDQSQYAYDRIHPDHLNNGDESKLTDTSASGNLNYLGNFSKGFQHSATSELTSDGIDSYNELLRAVNGGNPADFENISMNFNPPERKFVDPQAGLAFDLEGPDAASLTIPPAPSLESAQISGEMAELYWQMICRDIPFQEIQNVAQPEVNDALDASVDGSLNWMGLTDLRTHIPVDPVTNQVTGQTIFRGNAPGCLVGPYISQFLLIGNEYPDPNVYTGSPIYNPIDGFIRYGTQVIDQRHLSIDPGINFMGEWNDFLQIQDGRDPYAGGTFNQYNGQQRFITTPRDLANYVHYDALYQAYLNACIILLGMSARLDRGNPYLSSLNQEGFGTFGGPHILSLVTEVATRALKTVWYQKWFVHRRLRPEATGGVIEAVANQGHVLPINQEIIDAFQAAGPFSNYVTSLNNVTLPVGGNTFLLNQVFPEGSPMHPSYGAGHATVAGACTTILKAFFDEAMPFNTLYEPDPSGNNLNPIAGTSNVGYELNKVAYNIAYGRAMAGVHYRSDNDESLKLGEQIAIQILQEQKPSYNENEFFTLTKFDGTMIKI